MSPTKDLEYYKKKCLQLGAENRRLRSIQDRVKSLLDSGWVSPLKSPLALTPKRVAETTSTATVPTSPNMPIPLSLSLKLPGAKRQLWESKDDSFDRVPLKGPSYAYKGQPVRGKSRKVLPGQTCKKCEEYHKAANIEGSIQKCSKHRAEHPRAKTPPGFWSLDFPTTPELRARQSALPSPPENY